MHFNHSVEDEPKSAQLPISLPSSDENTTKDLRVITGAAAIDGGGGGGAATGAGGGDTFLIQKFVKSKGPHAFIVRQVINLTEPSPVSSRATGSFLVPINVICIGSLVSTNVACTDSSRGDQRCM